MTSTGSTPWKKLLTLESSPLLGGMFFGSFIVQAADGGAGANRAGGAGRWRAFFAAVVTAIAVAGISLVMFGAET
jgi:hypothetical protein